MDLARNKEDLKFYRDSISKLEKELLRVLDLIENYINERTYPILLARKKSLIQQISTFEFCIKVTKQELNVLSRG